MNVRDRNPRALLWSDASVSQYRVALRAYRELRGDTTARRWLRALARVLLVACALLLLILLAYGASWLLAWAWNGGVRRIFPRASVLSLVNVWQVWAAVGLCAAAAVGVGFLFRDVMTWWRGR